LIFVAQYIGLEFNSLPIKVYYWRL